MIEIQYSEIIDVARSFRESPFSTIEFANRLRELFPATMNSLEIEYGEGGAGAGKHFSAYSRIAQTLDKSAKRQLLVKLDYRDAPSEFGSPIIRYWCNIEASPQFPDEITRPEAFLEGAKQSVVVNRYERNLVARKICIGHWGTVCLVCGFDFYVRYGDLGLGYIHVHHLKPLSEIREEYELDPLADLRPVCANCHCMLHRSIPPLGIESLKNLLKREDGELNVVASAAE